MDVKEVQILRWVGTLRKVKEKGNKKRAASKSLNAWKPNQKKGARKAKVLGVHKRP